MITSQAQYDDRSRALYRRSIADLKTVYLACSPLMRPEDVKKWWKDDLVSSIIFVEAGARDRVELPATSDGQE